MCGGFNPQPDPPGNPDPSSIPGVGSPRETVGVGSPEETVGIDVDGSGRPGHNPGNKVGIGPSVQPGP